MANGFTMAWRGIFRKLYDLFGPDIFTSPDSTPVRRFDKYLGPHDREIYRDSFGIKKNLK